MAGQHLDLQENWRHPPITLSRTTTLCQQRMPSHQAALALEVAVVVRRAVIPHGQRRKYFFDVAGDNAVGITLASLLISCFSLFVVCDDQGQEEGQRDQLQWVSTVIK